MYPGVNAALVTCFCYSERPYHSVSFLTIYFPVIYGDAISVYY